MPKLCPPFCGGPSPELNAVAVSVAIATAPLWIPAAIVLWRRLR